MLHKLSIPEVSSYKAITTKRDHNMYIINKTAHKEFTDHLKLGITLSYKVSKANKGLVDEVT